MMNTMFGLITRNFLRAALTAMLSLTGFCAWAAPKTPWTVVDEQNRPVAGASVECYHTFYESRIDQSDLQQLEEQTLTDAKGHFQLTNSDNNFVVVVQKAGFSPAWVYFPKAVWNTSEPLVLAKPSVLEGTVVNSDHRPVSGALVWANRVHPENWSVTIPRANDLSGQITRKLFSAKTDKAGRFRIENFPAECSAGLGITMADYLQDAAGNSLYSLSFHSGQTNIELTLETAGSVEGKVLDQQSGQPVAGVNVQFRGYNRSGVSSSSTTGADGLFRVTEVAPGTNYPQVSFTGSLSDIWINVWTNSPVTAVAGKTVSNACVYVAKSVVAEVTVLSTNDLKPIANASVYGMESSIQTDSNGVARLRTTPGKSTIYIFHKNWAVVEREFPIEPGRTNFIKIIASPQDASKKGYDTLEASVFQNTVKGTVRDASGAPAPGVMISFYPGHYPRAPFHSETITDAKGQYELPIYTNSEGLNWAGEISPTNLIAARDLNRNLAAAIEFVEFPTNLDLTLQPGMSFSGTVRDLADAPITNALFNLRIGTGNTSSPLTSKPVKVDAQGSFTFTALPQNRRYDLDRLTAKGYGEISRFVFNAQTHTNHYVFTNLVLKLANSRLAGIVKDPNGKPLAGATVTLFGQGQKMGNSVQSDDQGHFSFESICEGAVQLTAYWHDANTVNKRLSADIHVDAGQTNVIIELK